MAPARLRPARPRTDPRWSYSCELIRKAILFLLGHEIAHISRGHVDYLESKTGTPLIAEMGWNQADQEGLIERQTLEADADLRSVISRIASLKLTHTTPNLDQPPWTDSPRAPGHLLFDWAFSMNSLFRLFGDNRFNASDLTVANYPPLPLRRTMATVAALTGVIEGWDPALKDVAGKALRLAIDCTELAFAAILGDGLSVAGLSDAFSPLGREHYKRLIDCWLGGLRDRLAPFAYELDPDQSVDWSTAIPQ